MSKWLLALGVVMPGFALCDERTSLRGYIAKPEQVYAWTVTPRTADDVHSMFEARLVSLEWHGVRWTHRLRVFRPKAPRFTDIGILLITGGNGSERDMALGRMACLEAGMTCAILYNIPNQPLFGDRVEDDLIAYTIERAMETGDMTWPLLLPMTKSVTKAMDVLEALSAAEFKVPLKRFILTGASKRGWTTWLAGAMDRRVVGIAPMVYDNLDIPAQMRHQKESWGRFSVQLDDYSRRGLMERIGTPGAKQVVALIDPFSYLSDLRMPKLILNASNDEYWTTDAVTLYWNKLRGSRSLFVVPNSGHGVANQLAVMRTIFAFARLTAQGRAMPAFGWQWRKKGGGVELSTSARGATAGRVWIARAPSKDFRAAKWTARPLAKQNGRFSTDISMTGSGYLAAFGELDFNDSGKPYSLSSAPTIWRCGK